MKLPCTCIWCKMDFFSESVEGNVSQSWSGRCGSQTLPIGMLHPLCFLRVWSNWFNVSYTDYMFTSSLNSRQQRCWSLKPFRACRETTAPEVYYLLQLLPLHFYPTLSLISTEWLICCLPRVIYHHSNPVRLWLIKYQPVTFMDQ